MLCWCFRRLCYTGRGNCWGWPYSWPIKEQHWQEAQGGSGCALWESWCQLVPGLWEAAAWPPFCRGILNWLPGQCFLLKKGREKVKSHEWLNFRGWLKREREKQSNEMTLYLGAFAWKVPLKFAFCFIWYHFHPFPGDTDVFWKNACKKTGCRRQKWILKSLTSFQRTELLQEAGLSAHL